MPPTHSIAVQGERSERIDDYDMSSGEGVYEGGAVSLPQDVENAGLVQVGQLNNVLHPV